MNIWKECTKVPITDLLNFIVDNRGKTVPTSESGHILIATNCIKNDSLYPKYEKVRYLSQETYDTFFRAHPLPGDIIFVCKGTPGRVCLVPDPIDFCIAQDMIALRVDSSKVDNHYLLAVLRSETIQKHIYNTSVGDVIPHFKKQFMDTIEVPLPPLEYQKRIGDLYYKLSNKIELNNKINAQLEEMAQAIFKSWFVDFEPFKDGKFVESELGMIPKGWRVGTLDEVCLKVTDGSHFSPKESSKESSKDAYPMLSVKDMRKYGFDYSSCKQISKSDFKLMIEADCVPHKNDILVAKDGSYLKEIFICSTEKEQAILSSIAIFRPNPDVIKPYYLLSLLKLPKILKDVKENYVSGSAVPRIVLKDFKKLPLVIPSVEIQNRVMTFIESIYQKIYTNSAESLHLSHLRDTLLPKLMNGEIEI